MSKIKLVDNFHYQWTQFGLSCKTAARQYAALPENASDPFCYARTIRDLQLGYADLVSIQNIVSGKLKHLNAAERGNMNERIRVFSGA